MRKFILVIVPLIIVAICTNAQVDSNVNVQPRHNITITKLNNGMVDGILTRTNDTSVFVYRGSFREWKQQKTSPTMAISYSSINRIQTKKRHGMLKGALIGAGIGILPVFLDAIFTPKGKAMSAEGGAYVSLVAVPLGTLVGGLIGATSKKKFQIAGDETKFQQFRKKIKK